MPLSFLKVSFPRASFATLERLSLQNGARLPISTSRSESSDFDHLSAIFQSNATRLSHTSCTRSDVRRQGPVLQTQNRLKMAPHSNLPAALAASALRPRPISSTTALLGLAASFLPMALGHEHGEDHIPDGEAVSAEPFDTILWIHILIQVLAYGVLFPVGMVLGMGKSRWHVPVQVLGTALALLGFALGHIHGGREFLESNIHAKFASVVFIQMLLQAMAGTFLKLHLEKGIYARVRPAVRLVHSINGKAFPVVSWAQMLFGGITALGFCQGDHLGQCVAHFIMGSAFVAYGIIMTLFLLVGQLWLRRIRRSPEFFDSVVIAAWGCVNTFTEHRWGTAWVKNDWQHTAMGIVWWAAGLVGVWLSKDGLGNPQRNFVPGFVIFITGWAFSAHPQTLMISAMTHKIFGWSLMGAGLTRIIEICFVLGDKLAMSESGDVFHSFQYIPPFLLCAAGFLFMGATEEQMTLVSATGIDHVAYVLIHYSLAFLLFFFVLILIQLYNWSAQPSSKKLTSVAVNRRVRINGDAEEFELGGLTDEDDEDEERAAQRSLLRHKEDLRSSDDTGPESPATVGGNSDRVA